MSDARRVTVEYQLLRAILNDDQMIVVCDNPNGHHALIQWEEFAAKDAVVEAARELEHIHADHAECRDVDDAICRCTLCIALRALDKPTCKTCGGSGELKDAVQAWDIPGAPIPECLDCGGE